MELAKLALGIAAGTDRRTESNLAGAGGGGGREPENVREGPAY